jgi:hypothetical protein
MTNYKKFLLLLQSILTMGVISSGVGLAIWWMFAINFWGVFLLTSIVQLIFPRLYDKFLYSKAIKDGLDEYNAKPYKKYQITLACQSCGHRENIDVDLNDTVYKCDHCHRMNGIYVTFTTAVISDTINQ